MALTRNELLEQILALTPQGNYTATLAPTVTDDSDSDYSAGSNWYNTSTGFLYTCVDATVGAAVWKQTA